MEIIKFISQLDEILRETDLRQFIIDLLPMLQQIDGSNGVNISADMIDGEVILKFASIPKDEDDFPDCDDCPYCCPNCGECIRDNFDD